MSIWFQEMNLALINARNETTLAALLGIQIVGIGADFLTAIMPITPQHQQPIGIMHGGASCVLAETVGSNAANYCVDLSKWYCVGLEINTNHVRSIRSGQVTAIAKPFHLGKSTQVWGINITDAANKLISVNRLTMAVLKQKK